MLLNVVPQAVITRVYGQDLTGLVNDVNTTFTTAQVFAAGTEAVYFNGVRQREGAANDYVRYESGGIGTGFDTILFAVAPRNRPGPKPDDVVSIDYDPT